MLIDTHAIIEELIDSGVKKKQAEIITRAINSQSDNVATKSDIKLLEAKIDKDIVEIKTELKWMRLLMIPVLLLLIKIAFFN